ncbi:MAG: nucleoside diphosphate kinase regulator [Dokdonella sp.]
MESNPAPIIVSSLDMERLEQLVELPAYRNFIGAEALRTELLRATVVDPDKIPADVVTMNSTALVEDEDSKEAHELTLVYPREADGSPGKVSVLAPVGSAMLGLRIGQSIEWQVPGGRRLRLRVQAIRYQPESSGNLHR